MISDDCDAGYSRHQLVPIHVGGSNRVGEDDGIIEE